MKLIKHREEIKDAIETLFYLKNKRGGWGELKTQESRLTNTCEAIWALSIINGPDARLRTSINFIKKGIDNKNDFSPQNCELARDYAWALIALTSIKIDKDSNHLLECFNKIKEKYNPKIGGFDQIYKPDVYNTFHTSIVIIGLLKLYVFIKDKSIEYERKLFEFINELIQNAKENIFNNGWGKNGKDEPVIGYTAYMLYAFTLFHNNVFKMNNLIDKAFELIERSENWDFSFDVVSRPDNRPYRHFAMAWILLAYQEYEFRNYSLIVLKKIIELKIECEKGWAYPVDILPSTWATALASLAIYLFTNKYSLTDYLRNEIIENKEIVTPNSNKTIKTIKTINIENRNVFIVHGHDLESLVFLEKILKEDFNLNPIIAKEEPNSGIKSLIEKFEECAKQCSTVIVLLSNDDEVKKGSETYMQPRPNAIFELGWFIARIPRNRIIIIKQEGTELLSDINGIVYINYKDDIKSSYRELLNELRSIKLTT